MHLSLVPELCRHLLRWISQFLTFFSSHYIQRKTTGKQSARPWASSQSNGIVSSQLGGEHFIKAFAHHGCGYGSEQLLQSRGSQFPQLSGITYLDHAATTLCSKQQLQEAQAEQLQHLLANPHSQLPSGLDYSAMAIEELRLLTLSMLNAPADEYEVVFVAGATAALKLVGETFPWTCSSSVCAYTTINHNSALGIRQQAAAAGATVTAVQPEQLQQSWLQAQSSADGSHQHHHHQQGHQPDYEQQQLQEQDVGQASVLSGHQGQPYSLFIAPAECNMSGTRCSCVELFQAWKQLQERQQSQQLQEPQQHQQQQVQQQHQQQQHQQQQQPVLSQQAPQQHQWLLLVDAAKACASQPPDCSSCSIDMLALSYYKIFGHPTGLGALVVRRRLLPLLHQHKAYFGGGTVEVVLPDSPHVVRRPGAAGLEDGTLPFTAIAAARHGFQQLQRLGGFPAISRHTACLTWHLMLRLLQLRHSNGGPAAVLYCHPAVQQLLQEHLTPTAPAAAAVNMNSSSNDLTSSSRRVGNTGTNNSSSSSIAGKGAVGGCGTELGLLVVPEPAVMQRFRELQGPVVCFNLLRPDGSWVGHKEVGKLAAIHSICLRTGCFCNPGACAHYLGLTSQDLLSHHAAGHVCWDDHDLIEGRPTGAVRASFGYMSSYEDVSVLLQFLQAFFVDNSGGLLSTATVEAGSRDSNDSSGVGLAEVGSGPSGSAVPRGKRMSGTASPAPAAAEEQGVHSPLAVDPSSRPMGQPAAAAVLQQSAGNGSSSGSSTLQPAGSAAVGCLTGLYLYPVKSCAPQQVAAWPIGPNGLLYDREWAVCGPDGQLLTQKRAPRLTQVRAEVDLQQQVLRLTAVGVQQQLLVPLHSAEAAAVAESGRDAVHQKQQQQQEVRVCGDRVCAQVLSGHVLGASIQHPEPSGRSSAATAAANSSPSMLPEAVGSDPAAAAAAVTAAAAGSDSAVQQWFTAAVGVPCRLVRQVSSSRTVKQQQQHQQVQVAINGSADSSTRDLLPGPLIQTTGSQTLGFANESQYLLVNQSSVDYVAVQLSTSGTPEAASSVQAGSAGVAAAGAMHAGASQVDALRFRPNLVVSGFEPWAEDGWTGVRFSPGGSAQPASAALAPASSPRAASCAGNCSVAHLQGSCHATDEPRAPQQQQAALPEVLAEQTVHPGVCLQVVGPCGRCDMVSIDQSTGQRRGSQLLSLLARERRVGGKLQFGVLLANTAVGLGRQCEQGGFSWLRVGDVVQPV